jgi:putative ATPase
LNTLNLAQKYRPKSFNDILSQEHLIGKNGIFTKFIEKNYFPNTLLFGKPGSGKTTIARIIAKELKLDFYEFNATSIKIDDIRKTVAKYKGTLLKPTIFIDEIHRLSKNQQEVLLPFMESREIVLIGASTSNPYYVLTAAFRSRSHLFELNSINFNDLKNYIQKIAKLESINATNEAIEYITSSSNGDVRGALNLLESSAIASDFNITLDIAKSIRSNNLQTGSSENDNHYDLISALIKSIRGSDIDAAIYYLARLIDGGEPPEFIARRLSILASEDIGNANPNALNLAASTLKIVEKIGYPEARIPLAQLTVYLASSPKSNSSYNAINSALKAIKEGLILDVPPHLKTHSKDYKYPHNFGGYVEQEYLQKTLNFYKSSNIGFEKSLNEWINKIKNKL